MATGSESESEKCFGGGRTAVAPVAAVPAGAAAGGAPRYPRIGKWAERPASSAARNRATTRPSSKSWLVCSLSSWRPARPAIAGRTAERRYALGHQRKIHRRPRTLLGASSAERSPLRSPAAVMNARACSTSASKFAPGHRVNTRFVNLLQHRTVRMALERIRKCIRENSWPGSGVGRE